MLQDVRRDGDRPPPFPPMPADPRRPGPEPSTPPSGIFALVNAAIGAFRRHALVMLSLAAIVIIPTGVLLLLADLHLTSTLEDVRSAGSERWLIVTDAEAGRVQVAEWLVLGASLLDLAVFVVAPVGFAVLVDADRRSTLPELRAALRTMRRRALPAIAIAIAIDAAAMAMVLLADAELGTAILVGGTILGVYVLIRWSVALPVLALEDVGFLGALGRSWELTAGHWWRTFAVLLLALLVTIVLAIGAAIAIGIVGLIAVEPLGGVDAIDPLVVDAIAGMLMDTALTPVVPIVATVLFFDLGRRAAKHPRPGPSWPG